LDADRERLNTQDRLDDTRAGVARAAVAVFRAIGGEWDPSGQVQQATNPVDDQRASRTMD
jgi:outer membrane protein TolC